MDAQTVVDYYGGLVEVARARGVSRQAVGKWVDVGRVPARQAILIWRDTRGRLKIKPELYLDPSSS